MHTKQESYTFLRPSGLRGSVDSLGLSLRIVMSRDSQMVEYSRAASLVAILSDRIRGTGVHIRIANPALKSPTSSAAQAVGRRLRKIKGNQDSKEVNPDQYLLCEIEKMGMRCEDRRVVLVVAEGASANIGISTDIERAALMHDVAIYTLSLGVPPRAEVVLRQPGLEIRFSEGADCSDETLAMLLSNRILQGCSKQIT